LGAGLAEASRPAGLVLGIGMDAEDPMGASGSMAGLVLAGGRSSRFGGEKAAARLRGRPLLRIALDRLAPDCAALAVSAAVGSEAERLAGEAGATVLPDPAGAPAGPLAGVCAGLSWANARGAALLAVAPCDLPLLPASLFRELRAALTDRDGAAVVRTPDGLQSLCLVARTELHAALEALLATGRHPPVHEWLADVGARELPMADGRPFLNVNTREDLDRLGG
jgi:molybdopterin-guanine dinucleotide biosynthesis protein A